MDETEILVVGAGPTGLALAAELKRAGQDCLLVDRLVSPPTTSRAAAIHARTLEVLEPLGATAELLAAGRIARRMRAFEGDTALLSLSFDDIPSRYPFILLCPQDRTEAILAARLAALGGQVLRGCTLLELAPVPDGLAVTLHAGERRRVRARWVIGCDGMHSAVREAAGIAFEGGTYAHDFVLADVRVDWPLPPDEVDVFFADDGILFAAPLPNGHVRMIATATNPPPTPTLADLQAIMTARGPVRVPAHIQEVAWTSRFRIHHRVATTFRQDRVVLLGDAAHVHSPAGGQGMNTGIQDAVALAPALVAAARGGGTDALDAWAQSRRRNAARVVAMTDRMTRLGVAGGRPARLARNALLRIVDHVPAFRRAIATNLAELHPGSDG